jgi:hypothetical protein
MRLHELHFHTENIFPETVKSLAENAGFIEADLQTGQAE